VPRFGLEQRLLAVAHVADAVVPIAQHDEALFGALVGQFLAQRTVQQLPGLLQVGKEKGHAKGRVLGHGIGQCALRVGAHVQRAGAQRGDHGRVVAQLRRRSHLHFDAASRLGLEHLGKLDCGFVPRVARRGAVAQGELGGLRLRGQRQQWQAASGHEGADEGLALHGVLSPVVGEVREPIISESTCRR
jgi:hypothetical protein